MPLLKAAKVIAPDPQMDELLDLFRECERKIVAQIGGAQKAGLSTRWLEARRKAIVEALGQAGNGSKAWFQETVPDSYRRGYDLATGLFKENGADVPFGSFASIPKDALRAVIENATGDIKNAMLNIGSRVNDVARRLQLETASRALTLGWTERDVAAQFRERMAGTGLIAKDGLHVAVGKYRGTVDDYAKMVARTSIAEGQRSGLYSTMLSTGRHDLVQVVGGDGCDLCDPWIGAVLSLTGKTDGYPTLAEAKAAGLFHPNCNHQPVPYIERFATESEKQLAQEKTASAIEAVAKSQEPSEEEVKLAARAA